MTFQPTESEAEYLAINAEWPAPEEEQDAFNNRMQQHYRSIAESVNAREIASYLAVTPSGPSGSIITDVESLTGQIWFGAPSETQHLVPRVTFRKVINFGELPNSSTKSVAHGIGLDSNSTMTKFYGAATDPTGPTFFPIPYVDTSAISSNISLTADGTNINITTGTNRTNFTRCIVVIEYLKN